MCLYFGFFFESTQFKFNLILPFTFPRIFHAGRGICYYTYIVGEAFLYRVDISAFPVLPVTLSQMFQPFHHHGNCDQDFASALEREDNRSAMNFHDIITINNICS
jgi:hypothetical protein